MKKTIVLVLVVLLLMSSFASAGFWDWVTGKAANTQVNGENSASKTGLLKSIFGNKKAEAKDSPLPGKPSASSGDKTGQKLTAKEAENGCILVCPSGSSGSDSGASALPGKSTGGPTGANSSANDNVASTDSANNVDGNKLTGKVVTAPIVCVRSCNDKFKTCTQVDLNPADVCAKNMQDCKTSCGSQPPGKSASASSGNEQGQKLTATETANGCMLVCFAGSSRGSSAASALSGSKGGPSRDDSSSSSALNELRVNGEQCATGTQCESSFCKLPPGPKTPSTRGVCAGNREDGAECVTDSQCVSNSCELPAGPKTARAKGKCVAAAAVEEES